MKKLIYILLPLAIAACGGAEEEEETNNENSEENVTTEEVVEETIEKRASPRLKEEFFGDNVTISIDYGSPRVRDRVVWGELVPYNQVWRAGADEVTALTFKQDVVIDGKDVPAGTYGLFIIPKEKGDWTFILNEEWSKEQHDVWGAYDYKEEKDVLRFDVPVEWMEESLNELTYSMNGDNFVFEWENARCEFPIKLKEGA